MLRSGKASPAPDPPSRRGSAALFGSERSRYRSAAAIQQYSGVATVTERSCKNQHWVHRRWGRPHFVHQSFFEYANQSVLHCRRAKLFVQEQMAKGQKHPTAVRALAFKWQRIHVRLLARPGRLRRDDLLHYKVKPRPSILVLVGQLLFDDICCSSNGMHNRKKRLGRGVSRYRYEKDRDACLVIFFTD